MVTQLVKLRKLWIYLRQLSGITRKMGSCLTSDELRVASAVSRMRIGSIALDRTFEDVRHVVARDQGIRASERIGR